MRLSRLAILVAIALTVTVLNALKPFAVDDTAYSLYAEHLTHAPLDPYGFQFLSTPAMETLAPPAFSYYLAAMMCLFGEQPIAWKLALFPLSLLLVVALHALFRRLASGAELSLTALVALSPVCLPCWNCMLDLPALALSLSALALYLMACDRSSLALALLAGLLGGLAMETKYTAFTIPIVVLLHGVLYRRLRLAFGASALMVGLFVVCEAWIAQRYGVSHFVWHLTHKRPGNPLLKLRLILPFVSLLGLVTPWLLWLSLTALGARLRTLVAVGLAYVGIVLAVALVPESWQVLVRAPEGWSRLDLSGLLYALSGVMVGVFGVLVLARRFHETDRRREVLFLAGWVGIELIAYFALTPFPAVRRLIGLCVVGTLVVGGLAARVGQREVVRGVAVAGIVLGLAFHVLDAWEAHRNREGIERAAQRIRDVEPDACIWYGGLGGTGMFYARRAGMLSYSDSPTEPGDWFVVEDDVPRPPPSDWEAELRDTIVLGGGPSLSTMPSFHAGGTGLVHHEGPRTTVLLYRRRSTAHVRR
jgi:hypothetical protein